MATPPCASGGSRDSSDADSTDSDSSDASEPSSISDDKAKVVKSLDRCLRVLEYVRTNHVIHKFFRAHADAVRDADNQQCISPQGVVEMAPKVAARLRLPSTLFDGLPTVFERFDFDGDNLLAKHECTKLYRAVLRQRRKELGGRTMRVDVPQDSVEGKGYEVQKELGRGGQGVMYLCTKRGKPKPYCVKFYKKESGDCDDLDDIIEEYAMMKKFSSPRIAKTHEIFQDDQHYYLVNEPYFGGDLTKLAKRAHDQKVDMSEAWWREIFLQCLEGLEYLHSQAIIHCDIKEANIMVASDEDYSRPDVVLIDFGLAAAFGKVRQGASGTPGYIPPETHDTGKWYPRGDIFSLGITFFQLMVGQVPRDDNSVVGVLQVSDDTKKIAQATREMPLPWARFPGGFLLLKDLLLKMTEKDRRTRPSAVQAQAHAWFQSESDAELPPAILGGLVGASAAQCAGDKVISQLVAANNLRELRVLQTLQDSLAEGRDGKIDASKVPGLLQAHGVTPLTATAFADALEQPDGKVECRHVVQESIRLKEQYSEQYVRELFDESDQDGMGRLPTERLEALMESDIFELAESEVEELAADLPVDEDGMVSYEEFSKAVLSDGRIGRRVNQTIRYRINKTQNRCCYCS